MNRTVLAVSLVAVALASCGEGYAGETSPIALDFSGELHAGVRLVRGDGASTPDYLVIENTITTGQTFRLASIESPGITHPTHAIIGDVRYEGVSGDAYLMMANYFPDGGPYFSKGLDSRGVGKIKGDSDWRSFSLPFFCMGQEGVDSGRRPSKIELLMVMPSSGTVYLRNVRLEQFASGVSPFTMTGQWWTGRQAGLVGGIGGGVIGCFGGLIGGLVGTGRARRFVIAAMTGMIVAGVASLVLGVVALGCSQPYSVYYPLLLFGVLLIALPAALLPNTRRRYAEVELRKMNAGDVG